MAANIDTSQIESFSDDELDAEMESTLREIDRLNLISNALDIWEEHWEGQAEHRKQQLEHWKRQAEHWERRAYLTELLADAKQAHLDYLKTTLPQHDEQPFDVVNHQHVVTLASQHMQSQQIVMQQQPQAMIQTPCPQPPGGASNSNHN